MSAWVLQWPSGWTIRPVHEKPPTQPPFWIMKNSWRRILIGGTFFGMSCIIAIGGYMLAGWKLLDAVYMVVITVFGVGYGEAKPLESPELKIFTMGVIIAGCSSAIYVVGGFVQMVAEGEINRALGVRRMSKGIEKLTNHALICGFGRVGQMLAQELAAANFPMVIVDSSEERVQKAQADGFLTVLGSASEEQTLLTAGIGSARVLATVLPDDSANVFITLTARDLNSTIEIISRAESPSTEKKLLRSGANRVIMPAVIGATRMAHMIVTPSGDELLTKVIGKGHLKEDLKQVGLEINEIEIQANSSLVGQTVGRVEIGGKGGFVMVAIKKSDGSFIRNPTPDLSLNAGDVFIILSHQDLVPELAARAKPRAVAYHRGVVVSN